MDPVVLHMVKEFLSGEAPDTRVADLGAFNINGAVKDVWPSVVGFDLQEGPGVDVVLELGDIPDEHWEAYDIVTAISSFAFGPSLTRFKAEVYDLLRAQGRVFLTLCDPSCDIKHSTTTVTSDVKRWRWSVDQVEELLKPEFQEIYRVMVSWKDHPTWIFVARKVA